MTRMYDLCTAINAHLERQHGGSPMELIRAKGEVATKVGFLVSLVTPNDPDDADKVARLERVARDLGVV